jgi:hypothetical protein
VTRLSTVEDIRSNATAKLRKIPKETSAGASDSGRNVGTIAYVLRGPSLKVVKLALPYGPPLQCSGTSLGTF